MELNLKNLLYAYIESYINYGDNIEEETLKDFQESFITDLSYDKHFTLNPTNINLINEVCEEIWSNYMELK